MKVWLLYGAYLEDGIVYETLLGVFATKELMMDYHRYEQADSNYAYIEYAEHIVIED